MKITDIPKGSLICRTDPAKRQEERHNENLGIDTVVTLYEDNSYIGDPVKLLDVSNGMIYVEFVGKSRRMDGDRRHQLPIHTFAEGWNYFVMPDGFNMEYFQKKFVYPPKPPLPD